MNQQDKIELSKRVAEKYLIEPYYSWGFDDTYKTMPLLSDDTEQCFKLLLDNNLEITVYSNFVKVKSIENYLYESSEPITNSCGKYEAARIAILKCLDAMKE